MRRTILALAAVLCACSARTDVGAEAPTSTSSPNSGETSPASSVEEYFAGVEAGLTDRERASVKAYSEWREALLAGKVDPSPDIAENFNAYAKREAEAQGDPFAQDLLARVKRDQLGRFDIKFVPGQLVSIFRARGLELDPADESAVNNMLSRDLWKTDKANTAWLKERLAANGDHWWPISEVGEESSNDLWLLVQHADQDEDFQKHVLSLMEPLAKAGEVNAKNFAYLYDRVNDPQRYGTQLECSDGVFQPRPLEDPAHVDELRASVGLGPEAEYVGLSAFDAARDQCAAESDTQTTAQ